MAAFQFQTGAIRSRFYIIDRKPKTRFNSKLVRLEGSHLRQNRLHHTCFNSKLVRLEVDLQQHA